MSELPRSTCSFHILDGEGVSASSSNSAPWGDDSFMSPPASFNSGFTSQIESFFHTARSMEQELSRERSAYVALDQKYRALYERYETAVKEAEVRGKQLQVGEQKLKSLQEAMHREKLGKSQHAEDLRSEIQIKAKEINELRAQVRKLNDELGRFHRSIAELRRREEEARSYILEGRKFKLHVEELKKQLQRYSGAYEAEKKKREKSDRHAQNYQNELQATLIRIHSAESRFNELSKEYQLIKQAKRDFNQELEKIEHSVRERYRWELMKERETFKAEREKDLAVQREKLRTEFLEQRESMRNQIRQELESQYQDSLNTLKIELQESNRSLVESNERLGRSEKEKGILEGQLLALEESKAKEAALWDKQREKLHLDHAVLETSRSQARKEIENLGRLLKEEKRQSRELNQKVTQLEESLREAQIEIERSESRTRDRESQYLKLENEFGDTSLKCQALEESLRLTRDLHQEQSKDVTELKARLAEADAQRHQLELALSQVRAEGEREQARTGLLKKDLDRLQKEKGLLKTAFQSEYERALRLETYLDQWIRFDQEQDFEKQEGACDAQPLKAQPDPFSPLTT